MFMFVQKKLEHEHKLKCNQAKKQYYIYEIEIVNAIKTYITSFLWWNFSFIYFLLHNNNSKNHYIIHTKGNTSLHYSCLVSLLLVYYIILHYSKTYCKLQKKHIQSNIINMNIKVTQVKASTLFFFIFFFFFLYIYYIYYIMVRVKSLSSSVGSINVKCFIHFLKHNLHNFSTH